MSHLSGFGQLYDSSVSAAAVSAQPAPSTPLGPFLDSAVAWGTWVSLMGFVGLVALALLVTGPVAVRLGRSAVTSTTTRLTRVAAAVGVLFLPSFVLEVAHDLAGDDGGFLYSDVRGALFDGTAAGRLLGLEIVLAIVGLVLILPLTSRTVAASSGRRWLLVGGFTASLLALGTTKFPDEVPDAGEWSRTIFSTAMWGLHLLGGAIWIGGLIGLVMLTLPGGVPAGERSDFWPPVIRRFSVVAMGCVAAIALSGLWLSWSHVDGPTQLFTTMYGRVLGVKILIFGSMLLLGMVNQFSLHPKITAMRAAGDDRSLLAILATEFRAAVAVEAVLGVSILMVAPFLHGSARSQAFQAQAAADGVTGKLPKLPPKEVMTSTWIYGTLETLAIIGVMLVSFWVSNRIAKRRATETYPTSPTARENEPVRT
jgi:putative copper export protein